MIIEHVKPSGWVDTAEPGLIQPSEVAGLVHVVTLEPGDIALLTGPAGPQGPQGLQGVPGSGAGDPVPGPQGDTGPAGPQGLKGDTGDTGPAGPQGLKGDTGDTGPAGPLGLKGDTGDTGPAGPQGLKGDTGDTGPAGPLGLKGNTGPAGPAGLNGVLNDFVVDFGPVNVSGPAVWFVDHGLPQVPRFVVPELVCLVGNSGYSVGEVLEPGGLWTGTGQMYSGQIYKGPQKVGVVGYVGYTFVIWDKAGGAATMGGVNWKLRYRIIP